ncbi:adrenocortical dysplasia protein homolog [Carettochelys insculpta]|uniref:adrenocortical dysplasia protein homolog n=1 Tax=Carettochelys insculpta TaxID=44489 RepID=UPI003EBE399F
MRERGQATPESCRHISGLSVCYLPRAAVSQARSLDGMQRLEDRRRQLSIPKVYVLQPWVVNLLVKYGQVDTRDTQVPGHILKVVSELKTADQAAAAVLCISDGSYYIRAVVSPEAVRAAECAQLQSGFASILGRIIVLQDYRVCFQEGTNVEQCEFYLAVQRFIVLPLQRQRMESLNCNQEPSVLQKIKELWQRGLSLKTVSSSGSLVTQLMMDIGQRRLESLKRNVEDCLAALDQGEVLAPGEQIPGTKWEAVRKEEKGSEEVFTVPVHFLVIRPEEKAQITAACQPAAPQTSLGSSRQDGALEDCSAVSYLGGSLAMSHSLETSLDDPWDQVQSMSVTVSSSLEEKSGAQPSPPETRLAKSREEVAITQPDSNTPDFLEPPSQESPGNLSQGDAAAPGSPSLLSCVSNSCPSEAAAGQGAPAADEHPDASPDLPCGQPQTSLRPLSPATGSTACPASRGPADGGGLPSPPAVGTSCPEPGSGAGGAGCSRSRKLLPTKRKLLGGDDEAQAEGRPHPTRAQREPPCAAVPTAAERRLQRKAAGQSPGGELRSVRRAKKSRLELVRPAQKPMGRGKETASASSAGASGPGRPQAQQQEYVKPTPFQYAYAAPTPDLCTRVASTRISKAMLRWACWVIAEAECP